jgi:hypothetical protein
MTRLVYSAVAALTLCSGVIPTPVGAEPIGQPPEQPYFLVGQEPINPASPRPNTQPLMGLLDQVGVGQPLRDARINLFGHIEGSYTYNFDDPAGDLNLGRVFDLKHDRPTLNQIDFNAERLVDLTSHQFDLGGRVEFLYGGDARFIHSNGILGHQDFFHGPEYQPDLTQLYLDVAVPVGNGLRVRAGKFLFFKQIDPNASVFYSHSFTFGAALPFTLTGLTGYYPIDDRWSVEGGISRGWGQSLKDNNGAIDALGRIRYRAGDQTDIALAFITGPELDRDNSHYRTAVDFTVSQAVTDRLTLLLDAVLGHQAQPSGMTDANWYGLAGYAVYRINEYLSAAARLEWYRDEEGFTTAVSQTLFEATVGVTITPFPTDPVGANFKLRPELRADYSTKNYFDGLSRHDQWTAAIDAIFNF